MILKSQKLLFITHFYPPEACAASIRVSYFVRALRNAGYKVSVIAPRPNYPLGRSYSGFTNFINRNIESDTVYLPIFFTKSKSAVGRLFSYLSYSISILLYSSNLKNEYNFVITSTPPIFTAFVASVVSKKLKSKFILDIRDIWPDIGIELGILKNNFFIRILKRVEIKILNRSKLILVTALGDKQNLIRKGISKDIVKVIYNGADLSLFKQYKRSEKTIIREKYALPTDKKIICYFGSFNYGMNDIDTMGKALCLLESFSHKFHLVVIGEGTTKSDFIYKIRNKLQFTDFGSLSPTEIAEIVPSCDLSLIPRKKINRDTGGNIPVKCFESWASGLPVILSTIKGDEITGIFDKTKAGVLIESQDPKALAGAILGLINRDDLSSMGNRGKNITAEKFDRIKNSNFLAQFIADLNNERENN